MAHAFHCKAGCTHERHQKYLDAFKDNVYESSFLWNLATYVWDSNISPDDPDDYELFQDFVFDSKFGRVHIYFYDQYLFQRYYHLNPEWVIKVFVRYLEFLERASPLFTNDAFDFIYRKKDSKLILILLNKMSFDIKMRFVKHSEKYSDIIQLVPKLKLYNLFS